MNTMAPVRPAGPQCGPVPLSERVTNAVQHEETGTVTCSPARLRVDVHDTARSLPVTMDAPGDAESGRGLKLAAALPPGGCGPRGI